METCKQSLQDKATLSHLIKSVFLELLWCAKPRLVQVRDRPEPAATSEQTLAQMVLKEGTVRSVLTPAGSSQC